MGETGDTEQTPDGRLITETGHGSHALGQDELQSAGGAVRVVLDWIEAICKATARMLLNDKPCTLATAATGLPERTVDQFWRTMVIQIVQEQGVPRWVPRLVK